MKAASCQALDRLVTVGKVLSSLLIIDLILIRLNTIVIVEIHNFLNMNITDKHAGIPEWQLFIR